MVRHQRERERERSADEGYEIRVVSSIPIAPKISPHTSMVLTSIASFELAIFSAV